MPSLGANQLHPDEYIARLGSGRIVRWAPQQKVLSHGSVACFVSHCGWNSVLEGVSNGVPFVCWPSFGDQIPNATQICDFWGNGVSLKKDEAGIVTRVEIKNQVEKVLGNPTFKAKAVDLKEKAMESVRTGGSCYKNFYDFIEWIKGGNGKTENHPVPAQGHVIPLMELAKCLAIKGLKVTFVNTDLSHKLLMNALQEKEGSDGLVHMVSIPDEEEPSEDRADIGKMTEAIFRFGPGKLEELIENINGRDGEKITYLIFDYHMGWAVGVAQKLGIRRSCFCPNSAASWAVAMSAQKLVEDGFINENGVPLKDETIQLWPTMPPVNAAKLPWACIGDRNTTKIMFQFDIIECNKAAEMVDWIICNSAMELEPGGFTLFPNMLPIGPILASNRLANQAGQFWKEDYDCLAWLDEQQAGSVVYVAFGSFAAIDQTQFEELARGLELTEKPFLWVVRAGTNHVYPNGYMARIGSRGRIVRWAPQQKVLSHGSVACFVSHCGWNSVLEGVSNGVPFLCWPNFADQYMNTSQVCELWENGVGLNKDETGIVTRVEIKNQVEKVLGDPTFKEKAVESVRTGGSSYKNLSGLINRIKGKNGKTEHRPEKNT